jgi:hypothetical protein
MFGRPIGCSSILLARLFSHCLSRDATDIC